MPSQPPSSPPTVSTVYILFSPSHNFSGKKKKRKKKTTTITVAITTTGNTTLRFLHWWVFPKHKIHALEVGFNTCSQCTNLRCDEKDNRNRWVNSSIHLKRACKASHKLCLVYVCYAHMYVHVQRCITFVASHEHTHEFHSVIFPANSPEPCTANHIHDNSISVFLMCFQCMQTAETAL